MTLQGEPSTSILEPTLISLLENAKSFGNLGRREESGKGRIEKRNGFDGDEDGDGRRQGLEVSLKLVIPAMGSGAGSQYLCAFLDLPPRQIHESGEQTRPVSAASLTRDKRIKEQPNCTDNQSPATSSFVSAQPQ